MLNFMPMVYMADNHYSVISQYYRYIEYMRITNKVAQQTFLMINFQKGRKLNHCISVRFLHIGIDLSAPCRSLKLFRILESSKGPDFAI